KLARGGRSGRPRWPRPSSRGGRTARARGEAGSGSCARIDLGLRAVNEPTGEPGDPQSSRRTVVAFLHLVVRNGWHSQPAIGRGDSHTLVGFFSGTSRMSSSVITIRPRCTAHT